MVICSHQGLVFSHCLFGGGLRGEPTSKKEYRSKSDWMQTDWVLKIFMSDLFFFVQKMFCQKCRSKMVGSKKNLILIQPYPTIPYRLNLFWPGQSWPVLNCFDRPEPNFDTFKLPYTLLKHCKDTLQTNCRRPQNFSFLGHIRFCMQSWPVVG